MAGLGFNAHVSWDGLPKVLESVAEANPSEEASTVDSPPPEDSSPTGNCFSDESSKPPTPDDNRSFTTEGSSLTVKTEDDSPVNNSSLRTISNIAEEASLSKNQNAHQQPDSSTPSAVKFFIGDGSMPPPEPEALPRLHNTDLLVSTPRWSDKDDWPCRSNTDTPVTTLGWSSWDTPANVAQFWNATSSTPRSLRAVSPRSRSYSIVPRTPVRTSANNTRATSASLTPRSFASLTPRSFSSSRTRSVSPCAASLTPRSFMSRSCSGRGVLSMTSTADTLIRDEERGQWSDAFSCGSCGSELNKLKCNPRHHCRACKASVCAKCSPNRVKLEGQQHLMRICTPCVASELKPTIVKNMAVQHRPKKYTSISDPFSLIHGWSFAPDCSVCSKKLGKRRLKPRHHCRICKASVCNDCSPNKIQLNKDLLRVCTRCMDTACQTTQAPLVKKQLSVISTKLSGLMKEQISGTSDSEQMVKTSDSKMESARCNGKGFHTLDPAELSAKLETVKIMRDREGQNSEASRLETLKTICDRRGENSEASRSDKDHHERALLENVEPQVQIDKPPLLEDTVRRRKTRAITAWFGEEALETPAADPEPRKTRAITAWFGEEALGTEAAGPDPTALLPSEVRWQLASGVEEACFGDSFGSESIVTQERAIKIRSDALWQGQQKVLEQALVRAEKAEKQLSEERHKWLQVVDARATLDTCYERREREARQKMMAQILEERQGREELQISLDAAKAEQAAARARMDEGERQLSEERHALLEALEQQKKASEACC